MTADRRRRAHYARVTLRRSGWYDLAHRHRRRAWREGLRRLCGKVRLQEDNCGE